MHDVATLEAYAVFRREAADLGIRHFLEVFNPNAPVGLDPAQVGGFVNDSIVRMLAGVVAAQRPVFLKMAYNGADALAELTEHDPSVVVGILGGSAGTTRDTFELLHRAETHGGRVALFGRKIQRAESQLDLVGSDAAGAARRAVPGGCGPGVPRGARQGRPHPVPRVLRGPRGDRSGVARRMTDGSPRTLNACRCARRHWWVLWPAPSWWTSAS